MIEAFIRGSLNQRLIVMVISAMLIIGGFFAAQKLSLDAFPDVTNIQVQVATVATGNLLKRLRGSLPYLLKLL